MARVVVSVNVAILTTAHAQSVPRCRLSGDLARSTEPRGRDFPPLTRSAKDRTMGALNAYDPGALNKQLKIRLYSIYLIACVSGQHGETLHSNMCSFFPRLWLGKIFCTLVQCLTILTANPWYIDLYSVRLAASRNGEP